MHGEWTKKKTEWTKKKLFAQVLVIIFTLLLLLIVSFVTVSITIRLVVKRPYLWLNWLFQIQTVQFDLADYKHS